MLVRRFLKTTITREQKKDEKLQRKSFQGSKLIEKIICVGIKTSKNVYAEFRAGRMRELNIKRCKAKIIYPGINTL